MCRPEDELLSSISIRSLLVMYLRSVNIMSALSRVAVLPSNVQLNSAKRPSSGLDFNVSRLDFTPKDHAVEKAAVRGEEVTSPVSSIDVEYNSSQKALSS